MAAQILEAFKLILYNDLLLLTSLRASVRYPAEHSYQCQPLHGLDTFVCLNNSQAGWVPITVMATTLEAIIGGVLLDGGLYDHPGLGPS